VADVAQLVESQIVILVVAGSSPVVRPTEYHFKSSSLGAFSFLRDYLLPLGTVIEDAAARANFMNSRA
jgi:hypothetical protein